MHIETHSAAQSRHANSAPKKQTPAERVRKAATAAMEQARGDWDEAAAILERKANDTRQLRDAILLPLLRQACRDAVRMYSSSQRNAVLRGPGPAARGAGGITELARSWYDWPLRGGRTLGQASRAEVSTEREWYATLAHSNGVRARFFKLIEDTLLDVGVVQDQLSAQRIEQFAKDVGLEAAS